MGIRGMGHRLEYSAMWRLFGVVLFLAMLGGSSEDNWAVCDNRAYRDEDVEPGGLKLLGVKESPLGDYPEVASTMTHEHFFQQLREVWTDDCPRVMVQLGLQPAAGPMRNWTAAALWLHYFNHSGVVLVVDAVEDYLRHFDDSLRSDSYAPLVGEGRVSATTVRAALAAEGRGKAKERPVSFDALRGGRVLAADEVMRTCTDELPGKEDPAHPCARIIRRMAQPDPLEYVAPILSFDEVWRRDLGGRHVDFLQVDLGAAGMGDMFQKGFDQIMRAREVSILAFRIDEMWTKAELKRVVEWLDSFEYFTLFKVVCPSSSQVGTFTYHGPAGSGNGPTTYLPVSGVDFDKAIDWDQMPLPQDLIALDLRQPDIFKTIQLGDVHCDVDEAEGQDSESCAADGSGKCRESDKTPPEPPQRLRVIRSDSRSLAIEWRAHQEGARPDSYALRVDPGAQEDSLEHDVYDTVTGVQTHTISSLQPDTEYTIALRSMGAAGESPAVKIAHRTEREERPSVSSPYDVAEKLHCGMSSSEEVSPPGPPPAGGSFFRDVTDADGCQARCDDSRQCVAFQVKIGDACWLYRRKPVQGRMNGPRNDLGWVCGVYKHNK